MHDSLKQDEEYAVVKFKKVLLCEHVLQIYDWK